MSFLNPTPVPVRLYSHTDTDAPQLPANNWTGAIKTLLKACLVTGYGGKPGAGWTLREESDNKAIFAMGDPACPPVELEVDSSNINTTTFDLYWRGEKQGITGETAVRNTYITGWYLVASSRSFALLPVMTSSNYTSATLLYYGQSCTNLVNSGLQDYLLWDAMVGGANTPSQVGIALSANSNSAYICSSGNLRTGGKVGNARNTLSRCSAYATGNFGGLPRLPTDNDMAAIAYGEIYLQQFGRGVVGRVPGLLIASHRTVRDQTGDIMQVAGSPHRWLYTNHEYNIGGNTGGSAVLVNLDEWVY